MNRRSSILIALVAVGALAAVQSGCNEPSCGPGTVQQQQKDGTLKCVQTDDLNSMTPCEVDGGNVMIVGGKCVSAVQCDPALDHRNQRRLRRHREQRGDLPHAGSGQGLRLRLDHRLQDQHEGLDADRRRALRPHRGADARRDAHRHV